jgi:hypothetical protein
LWAWANGISGTGPRKSPSMLRRFLPVETIVQAVPDQVTVLDFG